MIPSHIEISILKYLDNTITAQQEEALEAWFDWRRTGLPALEKNVIQGAKGQDIPKRQFLSDPFNEDNLTEATGRLQPAVNDQWSLMWLLQ